MANSLLIKASTLRDWVTCRRRVWLNRYADEGEKDDLPPITIQGNSLKVVARYLGFRWSGYDNFRMAYEDYRKWLERGDLGHLAAVCAYQRDDALALEVVRQWMAG